MQYNVKHLDPKSGVSDGLASSLKHYPVAGADPVTHLAHGPDEKCSPVFL